MESNRSKDKISVIIPCFNQGAYLNEAVDSVFSQTYQNFEIVIVNDGSDDKHTNKILENYNKPKTKIIHTSNQGLAHARNNGIKASEGIYILPLDADDKIGSEYLEKGKWILDENEKVGIVYCKAEFFEMRKGEWKLPEFRFPEFLLGNCIFCTSMFRRADYDRTSGYNPNMIYGWEDYDFWLSLLEMGKEVYCIPETLFYYRIKKESMHKSMTHEQVVYSYLQILKNHRELYADNVEFIFEQLIRKIVYGKSPFRINLKIWKKRIQKILTAK